MSAAADRLEILATFFSAERILRMPDKEVRERDAALLNNVAALVRACENQCIHSDGFLPPRVEKALAALQEDGK